jgi:isopenicillin N synthase-like dioxygenase
MNNIINFKNYAKHANSNSIKQMIDAEIKDDVGFIEIKSYDYEYDQVDDVIEKLLLFNTLDTQEKENYYVALSNLISLMICETQNKLNPRDIIRLDLVMDELI